MVKLAVVRKGNDEGQVWNYLRFHASLPLRPCPGTFIQCSLFTVHQSLPVSTSIRPCILNSRSPLLPVCAVIRYFTESMQHKGIIQFAVGLIPPAVSVLHCETVINLLLLLSIIYASLKPMVVITNEIMEHIVCIRTAVTDAGCQNTGLCTLWLYGHCLEISLYLSSFILYQRLQTFFFWCHTSLN